MDNKTITDFLNGYTKLATGEESSRLISFHMPGHKGRPEIYEKTGHGSFLRNIMTCDITEIPGADALLSPDSTLKAVMDNYAELYGVRHTELLVNGSSAGVMAAIIGCVPVGGKLILGRNSHRSAFNAMRLGGINPVYVRPETDPYSGLVGEISPAALKEACEANPDADAVLITSPNYYGLLSDVASLASVAHDHDMVLIVDQAHGAHLKFFDKDAAALKSDGAYVPFPYHAAESLGADIVINSTHKTLLSFTSSGIMNICTERIDISLIAESIRLLQTTSPSYILMGSLDINEKIMRAHGDVIVKRWRENLMRFYRKAMRINGLEIVGARQIENLLSQNNQVPLGGRTAAEMNGSAQVSNSMSVEDFNRAEVSLRENGSATGNEALRAADARIQDAFPMYRSRAGLDYTKINISMAGLGISGEQLDRELRHKGIISEMVHGEYVMLMTGAGNIVSDYDRLLEALSGLSESYGISRIGRRKPRPAEDFVLETAGVPFDTMSVPLYSADGMVLYDPIVAYPPGTPIACPGEILTLEVISYISDAIGRGEKLTGVDDEGMIRVGLVR